MMYHFFWGHQSVNRNLYGQYFWIPNMRWMTIYNLLTMAHTTKAHDDS